MNLETPAPLNLQQVLDGIDSLATQQPVAARIVAATDAADTNAKDLAAILAADVALAGRVMKMANSAYFGMRGRVTSLQLAVTVVGFTTVRTMATVAMIDAAEESRLPEDFWTVSTRLAAAAAQLGPKFGLRGPDALCIGVLAQLGSVLLFHHDPDGYRELLASEPAFATRRREETKRYGMSAVELTAAALETWGFPEPLILPLQRVDDRSSLAGGLLRASYEVVSRLTVPGHLPAPIGPLTQFRIRDEQLPEILYTVLNQAEDLHQVLVGN